MTDWVWELGKKEILGGNSKVSNLDMLIVFFLSFILVASMLSSLTLCKGRARVLIILGMVDEGETEHNSDE